MQLKARLLLLYITGLFFIPGSFGQTGLQPSPGESRNLELELWKIQKQLDDSIDIWDYETIREFTGNGIKLAEELDADTSLAFLHNIFGYYYYKAGELVAAKKEYLQAIEYLNRIPPENQTTLVMHLEGEVYQNLGVINDINGLTHFALKNYLLAIELFKTTGDTLSLADCLMNIGIIYSHKNEYKKAEEHFSKALDYFELLDDTLGLAILKLNQGVMYDELKNTGKAYEYYTTALHLSELIGDDFGIVIALNNIASIQIDEQKPEAVKKNLDIAFEISKQINDMALHGEVLYTLAKYYALIDKTAVAEKYFFDALRIASDEEIVELQLEILKSLSDFYSKNSNYKSAYNYLVYYDSLNTKIHTDDARRRFALIDKTYEEAAMKKDAALKELELKTISNKLKYNQILAISAVIGLFIIIVFIIVLCIRFKREKKIKTQLEEINRKLQQVNAEYQKTLISRKEKDVLLMEVQHRVKNNLQIINSLLRFHIKKIPKNMESIFADMQTRITAMALLHDQLYSARDLSSIDVQAYFTKLINNLKMAFTNTDEIEVEMKIDIGFLDLDTLHPLGLFINEVISNSFKYAFPDKTKNNRIYLYINAHADQIIVKVGDSGIGFGQKRSNRDTVGLELIETLAEQLGGSLELTSNSGTQYKLTFPKKH